MAKVNRRSFVKGSLVTAAAVGFPTIVPACVLGEDAPSNHINIGAIGVGRISRGHDMPGVLQYTGVAGPRNNRIIAVCDLDTNRVESGKQFVNDAYSKKLGKPYTGTVGYTDYRELLANKQIDAVLISTPDHQHAQLAVAATRAGKDVYLQKPASLTISEGRYMVNHVNATGRILQVGSQQRSWKQFHRACELVSNGRIGDVQRVEIGLPGDPAGGNAAPMHPIIDGYVVPEEPYAAYAAGRQNDVPILIGSNSDEGRPMIAGVDVKLATFAEDLSKAFYDSPVVRDLAQDYLKSYPAVTDQEGRERRAGFERDLRFGWDMWTWARMQTKTGQAKVFSYYFAHLPPYPRGSSFADWGAGHWAELPYVFDHLSQQPWAWSDADHATANMMATYWTNFAKSGDPNGDGVPVWPNFTNGSERVLHFEDSTTVGGVPDLDELRRLDLRYKSLRNATAVQTSNPR